MGQLNEDLTFWLNEIPEEEIVLPTKIYIKQLLRQLENIKLLESSYGNDTQPDYRRTNQ